MPKNINMDSEALSGIGRILDRKKDMIKLSLSACAHCSLCSDSCFKYKAAGKDPTYSPAYKMINSIGRIHKKKGKLSPDEYSRIKDLVWNRCVLCMRCYCPLGISIPSLIACARSICREMDIYRTYDDNAGGYDL